MIVMLPSSTSLDLQVAARRLSFLTVKLYLRVHGELLHYTP